MLAYFTGGRARVTVGQTDYAVQAGAVLALPKNTAYRIATLEPVEYYWVRYRLWLSAGKASDTHACLPRVCEPDDFADCVRELKIMERLRKQNEAGRIRVEAMAHALVVRHWTACPLDQPVPAQIDPRVWRARTLCLSCFSGAYQGELLARKSGLSHAQLHRLFRRYFHDTPKAFYEKARLKAVRRELRASALPVTEISGKYGFKDIAGFSHWFKRLAGLTPSQYRRRQHA